VSVDLHHGKAKKYSKTRKPFVPTSESTKTAMKEMALNGAKPAKIYRDLIDSAPTTAEEHKAFAPRDGRQVYNAIRNAKETRMISHHSFFNLHAIATYLNTFIRTINTFPSLRIFAVNLITVEIFREILFRDDLPTQTLSKIHRCILLL
jgi:hypothetical protein